MPSIEVDSALEELELDFLVKVKEVKKREDAQILIRNTRDSLRVLKGNTDQDTQFMTYDHLTGRKEKFNRIEEKIAALEQSFAE